MVVQALPATSILESEETKKAIAASKSQWLADLAKLLAEAQSRFSDVSWSDGNSHIYAHKAILYARAGAAFQSRYLASSRLQTLMSASSLGVPLSSRVNSLSVSPNTSSHGHNTPRAVSPGAFSTQSFTSTARPQSFPLEPHEAPFFKLILNYLYTAKDSETVSSFLFEDRATSLSEEDAIDKLAQDLLFTWRSKLFADVNLQIDDLSTMNEGSEPREEVESVFASHRAILCVRSSYFAAQFSSHYADSRNTFYTLPSPPFSSATLHFILGYLYTGTLHFSSRTFDLTVGMEIWRGAQYISNELLREEAQCRLVDMCHGFKGCCRTCRSRIARILAFACSPDVNSEKLRSGALQIASRFPGEIWCCVEIGNLDQAIRDRLVQQTTPLVTPSTACHYFKATTEISSRLQSERTAWSDHVRILIEPLQGKLRGLLTNNFNDIAESQGFLDLLEGVGFSDDILEKVLSTLLECLDENTATQTYSTLVGKILLREEGLRMDARVLIEDARKGIISFLKRRWIGSRSSGSFDNLENWCLKELSDELDIPVEDLHSPTPEQSVPISRTGLRAAVRRAPRAPDIAHEAVSGPPLRHSVLSRTAARKSTGSLASTTSSIRTGASAASSPNPRVVKTSRPSARPLMHTPPRVTSQSASIMLASDPNTPTDQAENTPTRPTRPAPTVPTLDASPRVRPTSNRSSLTNVRPASVRSVGAASVRSTAARSTLSVRSNATQSTTTSRLSTASTAKSSTLNSPAATRTPRTSSASTLGRATVPRPTPSTSDKPRVASMNSTATSKYTPTARRIASTSSAPSTPENRLTIPRKPSSASIISTRSATSIRTTRSTTSNQLTPTKASVKPRMPLPSVNAITPTPPRTKPILMAKSNVRPVEIVQSNETPTPLLPAKPPGTMLQIGMPCVVNIGSQTSQTVKFKAIVKYIGKVLFEEGEFVGVEVPEIVIDEASLEDALQWHDGTVDGIEYFTLGQPNITSPTRSPREPNLLSASILGSRRTSTESRPTSPAPTEVGKTRGVFLRPEQVVFLL